jgi:DnaJ family protein C protein 9
MPSRHEDLVAEPPSINPYQVLGIEEQATADEIKSAYRKKALQHHPGPSLSRLFPLPDEKR